MSGFLSGRSAVVTGGSRGIGLAISRSLLREGATVAICARTEASLDEGLKKLGEEGTVSGRVVDVADANAVADFFQFVDGSVGGPDILVNNAGIGIFRPVAELTTEEWRRTIGVNLDGVFYCSQQALPRMRKRGGGYIVNVSSLAGRNPFAGGAAYNASKFGVNGFSEALMLDHRTDRVRVTYIMPGSVDTDFSSRTARGSWKIAPEDVADVVLSVLKMPERTTISRVEIRPSIPQK